MKDLAARIEAQKLAALLDVPHAELGYLGALDPAELRKLREVVSTALYSRHEARFKRMAAVSRIMPAAISAKASALVGPALSAQIAGALEPEHAVKLAGAMRPDFLADVTSYLEPARVTEIVRAMPPEVVVSIGRILFERRQFLTLGSFTAVVDTEVALQVAEGMDGEELLQLAHHTEDRAALDAIVARIDDARLGAATAAAAKGEEFDEALALMSVLSAPNRARVIEQAAQLDVAERNGLIVGVTRNSAWDVLLEPLDLVSDDALRRIINVPASLDVAVLDELVERVKTMDRADLFEPVLLALDGQRLQALASSSVLARDDVQSWIAATPGLLQRLNGVLAKVT